jgi:hypothetical protein
MPACLPACLPACASLPPGDATIAMRNAQLPCHHPKIYEQGINIYQEHIPYIQTVPEKGREQS